MREPIWTAGTCGKDLFRRPAAIMLTSLLAIFSQGGEAADGGQSNYPYGALTSYSALVPAPGQTALFGYAVSYTADRVTDSKGKTVDGVEVELQAVAPRIVHTWNSHWLGASMSSGFLVEAINAKVTVPGADDTAMGPTLVGIEPLYMSWGIGPVHLWTGPVFYWPMGTYKPNRLANSTTGYESIAYQFATTWMPSPRWDVSVLLSTEFRQRNRETDYRGGTQGGVTFGVSHRPFANPAWDVGITGFFTQQFEDDRVGSQTVAGGGRTRKMALGPKLGYWFTPGTALIVQWHREFAARNAPEGDLLWLEFSLPITEL